MCQKITFVRVDSSFARTDKLQRQQRRSLIVMDSDGTSRVSGDLPISSAGVIERTSFLGTRRGWKNINRYEVIFLILGILAAIVTDGLTILRLTHIEDTRDSDLAYGILILVHSVFLLLFLITGIFYQRITDIVAFFLSAVLLTIYVIVHFIARMKNNNGEAAKDETIRIIRLVFTIVFNVLFLPLAVYVILDYRRDEFTKRVLGAFLADRLPLIIYNIFDCLARINTMLSVSSLLLNLYNFNDYEPIDKILLSLGIPVALLWLGFGIGMIRLEKYFLVVCFVLVSFFQPGFLGYCLYSAITKKSTTATTVATTTFTTLTSLSTIVTTGNITEISTTQLTTTTAAPLNLIPVLRVLYVCVGLNYFTHILSVFFGGWCVKNFGKGLKERIFNNRLDIWFQNYFNQC